MTECKFCSEFTGVCTNPESPMRADCCPVQDTPGVCRHECREEEPRLSPKGCAVAAAMAAGWINDTADPMMEVFWDEFFALMDKCGYIATEEQENA